MNKTTITINETNYKVKQSFRALMLFEEMTGKSVALMSEKIADVLKLFYCVLKANNSESFNYSFDEFLDLMDDYPEAITSFTEYLTSQLVVQAEKIEKKSNSLK